MERFWSKVDVRGPDECWPWLAGVDDSGYGKFWLHNRNDRAHRVAYELSCGPIPHGPGAHGTVVRHTCDNALCCNPRHLLPGTQADNNRDRAERGRSRKQDGTSNPNARLNEQQIAEIRRLADGGRSYRSLAEEFGVGKTIIERIVKRTAWTHV